MQIILTISGMSCQHCVGSVRAALQAVAGVQQVSVDLDQGRAVIEADESVSREALIDAVKQSGYEAG